MKEGYAFRQVKDICTKASSQVAQKDLDGLTGEYPIYGASGLIKNVNFYHQEKEYIGIVKDGSGIGRVMFLPPKSSVIGTLQYILPKEGYNIRYIGYCLQSLRLNEYKQGAAIPHIYFKDYGEAEIIISDNPKEQQRVVHLLDAEFAKIDTLKSNVEKNLQNAKDLFQAALKKELEPKYGWKQVLMGDVCVLSQGLAINSQTKHLLVEKSELPLLRIKDLREGTREIFVNEKECPPSCRAYPDDIIYTRTGTLGLIFTGMYGVMHNNCFKIQIDRKQIDKSFYMYYLRQTSFKNRVLEVAQRAAQPDITHKLFKEQPFTFPSISEQKKIAQILESVDGKCKTLQANYEKTLSLCDDLKQALLRKAFNGEL